MSHSWFGARLPGSHQHPHCCASHPSPSACPPLQGPELWGVQLGTAARSGALSLEEQVGQDCSLLARCSLLACSHGHADGSTRWGQPPSRRAPAPTGSLEGLPHPQFSLAQPHFSAREWEGYGDSRGVQLCQSRDSPHPRRDSLPAPRRTATAKFLYCLKQSQWHPRPEVTVCTIAAGRGCWGIPIAVHHMAASLQQQLLGAPCKSWNHRIVGQFGLERTSKGHLVQL